MAHVPDRGLHPGVVLICIHHECDVGLGRIRKFGVLEQHHLRDLHQLRGLAHGADWESCVIDVLGQFLQARLRRILGGVVDRNTIRGQADLPIQERLVVVRI